MRSIKLLSAIGILFLTCTLSAQTTTSNFFSNDSIGCLPNSVSFTNTSSNAISYLWDFGDGNTSTLSSPVNTYSTPGDYSVKLIAFSSSGDHDTLVFNNYIHVLDTPDISFSMSDDTLCPMIDTLALTNNTTLASTYLWDFGDGNISSSPSPVHTYQQQGNYTISLIAYNSLGCSSDISAPNTIRVRNKPGGFITSNHTSVCDTNSVISFNATLACNAQAVNWDFGDNTSALGNNPDHIYDQIGNYSVSAIVTDENGCKNTLSLTDSISVSQAITPQMEISDTTGCPPLMVLFSNNTPNTQTASWNINGSQFTGDTVSYTFTTTGEHDVQLGITDSNNCVTNTLFADIVSISETPIPSFSIPDSAGCVPLVSEIINTGDSAFLYNWQFNNGQQSSQFHPSFTFSESGSYNLVVTTTDPNGCSSTTMYNDRVQVYSAEPMVVLSEPQGCMPLSVTFEDISGNASSWSWNFGDGNFTNQQNSTHVFDSAGTYTIELITNNAIGCSDTLILTDTIQVIAPDYSYTVPDTITSCNGFISYFNGNSIGKDNWLWDFGDGSTSTSPTESHRFDTPGYYEVSLTTYDYNGCEFTIPNYNSFLISSLDAGFDFNMSCADGSFAFTDTSSGSLNWAWDFGDGTIDSVQNPTHTYAAPGVYPVQLTVSSNGCTESITTLISTAAAGCSIPAFESDSVQMEGDVTSFTFSSGSNWIYPYCTPFTMNFNAPIPNLVSILWDFGDGTTSTDLNPTHTYNTGGIFDLIITLETQDSTFTIHTPQFIWLNQQTADFEMSISNLCSGGANVSFSTADSLTQYWSFGDGSSSSATDPVHQYQSEGNYLTTLNVVDEFGCSSTIIKPVSVNYPNPYFFYENVSCLSETISFWSNIDNYQSYQWNFGNSSTALGDSVSHAYTEAGEYNVYVITTDETGCNDTISIPGVIAINDPTANFSFNDSIGCTTLSATFTNLSEQSDTWFWDFGDGTSSDAFSPSHNYSSPGVYDISLVSSISTCADTITAPASITIHEPVPAAFSYTKQNSCYPVALEFEVLTPEYESAYWDFGDGQVDSADAPIHTYYMENAPTIQLTTIDSNGCSSTTTLIGEEPYRSSFEITSLEGCVPVYANFSNLSDSAVSWLWDFGDGDTSSLPTPSHVFTNEGSYVVQLISTSTEGCVDTVSADYPILVQDLHADFETIDTASCAPMVNSFVDLSSGANNWFWNFGDSAISTLQNPSHIYLTPGDYTVELIAGRDSTCFDTILKPNFISVLGPIASYTLSDTVACDSLTVTFVNTSTGSSSTQWTFGDGYQSSDSIVFHTFSDTGSFNGTMVVYDENGCSDYTNLDEVTIYPSPTPNFSVSAAVGCAPSTISFTNSTANGDSYIWNMGNSFTSTDQHPQIVYDTPGTYNISFEVTNQFQCSSLSDTVSITINPVPEIDFIAKDDEQCFPAEISFLNLSEDTVNTTFTWNFYNGQVTQEISPTTVFTHAGEYDVQLIATNQYNCTSNLTKASFIHLNDSFAPVPNIVYTASVGEENDVFLKWEKSAENDISHYNVYRSDLSTQSFTMVDSIPFDINTTGYTDLVPQDQLYQFKIQPVDKCGNNLQLESLVEYRTIHLTTENIGESTVKLDWTPYIGCSPSEYYVYRTLGSETSLIAKLSSTYTTYIDDEFKCHTNYTYHISAENLCKSEYIATSNRSTIAVQNNRINLQTVDMVRSTVVDNEFVYTEWNEPLDYPEMVTNYILERSLSPEGGFEEISRVPSFVLQYTDMDVEVSTQNYYYRIGIENVCTQNKSNNISSSILLDQQSDGNKVQLQWTDYKGWDSGVEKYIIEKQVNDGDWVKIKEVDGSSNEAIEPIVE